MAGERRRQEAASVTAERVRCSAWLGVCVFAEAFILVLYCSPNLGEGLFWESSWRNVLDKARAFGLPIVAKRVTLEIGEHGRDVMDVVCVQPNNLGVGAVMPDEKQSMIK